MSEDALSLHAFIRDNLRRGATEFTIGAAETVDGPVYFQIMATVPIPETDMVEGQMAAFYALPDGGVILVNAPGDLVSPNIFDRANAVEMVPVNLEVPHVE